MRKLVKVKAKQLKPNPAQVRKPMSEEEKKILGQSVICRQETPLIIRSDGTILDGHRRWEGVMAIDPEQELEAVVTDEELDPTEIQLITSVHKKTLEPFELFRACVQWEEAHPQAKLAELAGKIGVSPPWLTQIRSLKDCIPAVRDAAEAGRIGPKDWYPISQADAVEQHRLLELRLNGGKREDLERETKKRRNGNGQAPAVRMQKVRIVLPGATLALSGKALDMAAVVELLEDCLKEARKAASIYDVKTWMRMMADRAKGSIAGG